MDIEASLGRMATRALEYLGAGRLTEAERLFRQILAVDPCHADSLHLLGLIANRRNAQQMACDLISRAIALDDRIPRYHHNLGNVLRAAGRLGEAADCYRRALALASDLTAARHALASTLQDLGRTADAIAQYEATLILRPDFAMALHNRGIALQASNRVDEAVANYLRAMTIDPDFAATHTNLALILEDRGEVDAAMKQFQQVIALWPDDPEAFLGLARLLLKAGRLDASIAAHARALTLNASHAQARSNLGVAFAKRGRFAAAIRQFEAALAMEPGSAASCGNLGMALEEQGSVGEAIRWFLRASALDPDDVQTFGQLLHARQLGCDWTSIGPDQEKLLRLLRGDRPGVEPFALLSIESTPHDQLRCARQWAAASVKGVVPLPEVNRRGHAGRIRLGYLSADMREHPVARLVVELIELHDRSRFEAFGYSYGPDDGSALRHRLTTAFDRFVDVRHGSHAEAAGRIRADQVDILIDLTGYTQQARPQIPAARPAPIQVSFLGFPGTMGADFIDYIVVDPYLVPMDQQPFFAEKLVQLSDCYQPSDRHRETAEPRPGRADCGLPERGFVFCCFNNIYKISAPVFATWMRLLRAVPNSVLWLLDGNGAATDNLRRLAAIGGVAPDRLIFAPRTTFPEYLARLSLADLFLDTLPYNAGATANDVLWMGLPLLTCAGATYVSRMAGSLLRTVGLPELVTASLEEYEQLAIRLARDPALLGNFRHRLTDGRRSTSLFDSRRYTHCLETAFEAVWQRWSEGLSPDGFAVAVE